MVIHKINNQLPSYLKELLLELDDIKEVQFICNDISKVSTKSELYKSHFEEDTSVVDELELTGQPLETSLDDLNANSSFLLERYRNWSSEEENYHPLKLNEARKLLNSELRQNNEDTKYTFILCDGNNDRHLVLLGASLSAKIGRTFVHILPIYRTSDELFLENKLKEENDMPVTDYSKITFAIRKSYSLYGPPLVNDALENSNEFKGAIFIEARYDDLEDREVFLNNLKLEMNLKCKVGHHNSSLHLFWEDFCLLYNYYNILSSDTLDETIVLSENGLELEDIILRFEKITNDYNLDGKTEGNLILKNSRNLSIADKIWCTLKYCKNLQSLLDGFGVILDSLSASPTNKLISDDEGCAKIINDLLQNKWILCNCHQALELLVEFGLAKLKQDYTEIFDNFSGINQQYINQNWSKFVYRPEPRRTTMKFKSLTKKDLHINSKFLLVYQMHIAAEFLILSHEELPRLSQETLHNLILTVNRIISTTKNIENIPLNVHTVKCSFKMSHIDSTLIGKLYPVKGSIHIKSISRNEEIVNIYFYNEFPLIPNIDSKLDDDEDTSGTKSYYVTKLVKYVNSL